MSSFFVPICFPRYQRSGNACPVLSFVCVLFVITSEAHYGRTDANGGHKDNKNKSGLGPYHYHCGDYPAHLHENGVCPYNGTKTPASSNASAEKKSSGANSGNSGNSGNAQMQTVQTGITQELMDSYALVFNADYYYNHNTDLQTTVGNDALKLFEHFYNNGMAEGRRGCEAFDVNAYKENNSDLFSVFGDDLKKYYDHYIQNGSKEGRVAN